MNYYPEQGRIHAVIVLKGPEEKLDPKEICRTRCGRQLPFENIVKDDEELRSLPQCRICCEASKNQLALAPGWRKMYLREK
ncbi:MAG: hypothetical protein HZC04_02180 [Candidatus Lloydbacteria bacterium]|nr:hypothetical protein [Candidatus Lloydbacteria bacterium]